MFCLSKRVSNRFWTLFVGVTNFCFYCFLNLIINKKHSLAWLLLLISLTRRFTFATNTFVGFLFLGIVLLANYFLPMCYFFLGENPFLWLFSFLMNQKTNTRVGIPIFLIELGKIWIDLKFFVFFFQDATPNDMVHSFWYFLLRLGHKTVYLRQEKEHWRRSRSKQHK